MNVLVIGSGAREHTLVWKLAQSKQVERLYAVPGNPGMAELAECIEGVSITDNAALVQVAQEKNVGLVVVGPEVPLMLLASRLLALYRLRLRLRVLSLFLRI